MNYLCLSCRAEIPEGDMLCDRCKRECERYMSRLGKCNEVLTRKQYKTLKGQALAGDIKGAKKGLAKVMRRMV